jgi:hypothetical protein
MKLPPRNGCPSRRGRLRRLGSETLINIDKARELLNHVGDPDLAGTPREAVECVVTPNPELPPSPRLDSIPVKFVDLTITLIKPKPRTRRYSLIRKWLKTRASRVPDPSVYQVAGFIVGHPETIAKLQTALNLFNDRQELLERRRRR